MISAVEYSFIASVLLSPSTCMYSNSNPFFLNDSIACSTKIVPFKYCLLGACRTLGIFTFILGKTGLYKDVSIRCLTICIFLK